MSERNSDLSEEPDRRGFVDRLREDPANLAGSNGHFYRGEIDRTTAWRARLDQTTNWAVIVVAAILTWAFSGSTNPHYVILIGMLAVGAFLVVETNRYREYDIWRRRVRILQAQVFADVYARRPRRNDDWRDELSQGLREPTFTVSFGQALAHRSRRVYFALLSILLVAWLARISAFVPEESWTQTAAISGLPGEVVVALVAAAYLGLGAVTLRFGRHHRVQEFEE